MAAVLEAAAKDITEALAEQGVDDRQSEAADEVVTDVAILHAYRVFVRICEQDGLTVDAELFADLAADLAEDLSETDDDDDDDD